MQVFGDEHAWSPVEDAPHELDRGRDVLLTDDSRGRRVATGATVQARRHGSEEHPQRSGARLQGGWHRRPLADDRLQRALDDVERAPELTRLGVPNQHRHTLQRGHELAGEPALADARLAADQRDPRLGEADSHGLQAAQLRHPADHHRAQPATHYRHVGHGSAHRVQASVSSLAACATGVSAVVPASRSITGRLRRTRRRPATLRSSACRAATAAVM